ncbi:hypothetical protein [Aquimarina sp. MMG016]|uniref:hypothetical protein n=1 Tax=Aquimarina sp. MMG016 TaxID=2822690 RepID=UPI001B39E2F5|nr:hypothetical protein [Aquimarina sp. MMG016]MBQ4818595.1 hypothetical protein [Aquimarina sp. MMG016]
MSLASAAIKLGENKTIMDSYWNFHTKKQNWFFSPNPKLAGSTRKPNSFASWNDWSALSSSQKSTLSSLSGFHYTASNVKKNNDHLARLKKAYQEWDSRLYSTFWSNSGSHKIWLCNVFVGDSIYLYNQRSFTAANRHYYDPRQILNGQTSLKKRIGYEETQPGDIVVIGTGHVEIITSLENHFIADDGFCSVGAGRGERGNNGDGRIRCDGAFNPRETRELDNKNNTYFYI